MDKKFGFVVDDFDRTTIHKNIGLFAQSIVAAGFEAVIITNANKYNKNINPQLPKGISLIRLHTKKKSWPPLDHVSLRIYFQKNKNKFFALWLYRGRSYSSWLVEFAFQNQIHTIIKLDSTVIFSRMTNLISQILHVFGCNTNLFLKIAGKFAKFVLWRFQLIGSPKLSALGRRFAEIILNLPPFAYFYCNDLPLSFASIILCETPQIIKSMAVYISKEKLFFYPNSVPISQFAQIEKQLFKKKLRKQNWIISVGRVVPAKGFENAIEAFSALDESIKRKWKLFIVGPFYDNQYLNGLKKLVAKYNLSNNIVFTGEKFYLDLYRYYFQSQILLMTYVKPRGTRGLEGQPNVIIEAMYFGNAVIATDVGNVSFLLDHGKAGILLEDNNIKTIAGNLSLLLNESTRRELCAKKARSRVVKEFNQNYYANQLIETIKHLDYDYYLYDQQISTITGERYRATIYKYCDFLVERLKNKVNFAEVSILDIGCREFFTYDYFMNKFKNRVTGIDIGTESLKYAKSKGIIDLDAHRLSEYFTSRKFDIILAFHAFEHMYDLNKCIQQCNNIINKNGYLFFAIPMPALNTRKGHWVDIKDEKIMIKLCKQNAFMPLFYKTYKAGIFRDENEMLGLFQK